MDKLTQFINKNAVVNLMSTILSYDKIKIALARRKLKWLIA